MDSIPTEALLWAVTVGLGPGKDLHQICMFFLGNPLDLAPR